MQPGSEHYYSYNRYLQETFKGKTYKVVVASGLTCPTRDGTLGKKGCAFCDVRGSSSYFGKQGRGMEISEQIRKRIPGIRERFHAEHFLAYFQSYTNTYSDVDYLREIYGAALSEPGIDGLCVGTRPDCLPDPVIDLLEEIAKTRYVSLELGVQSFEDPSLEWLDRGHSGQCSIDALEKLRKRAPHVHTCAHLMFGSPTDTPTAARDAAQLLNRLGVRGVKLHQLMILKNTELARRYEEKPFPTLSMDQYSEIVYDFLTHLSPEIYVERMCATATHFEECIAPEWSRSRWEPHNKIREFLAMKNLRQGALLGSVMGSLAAIGLGLSTVSVAKAEGPTTPIAEPMNELTHPTSSADTNPLPTQVTTDTPHTFDHRRYFGLQAGVNFSYFQPSLPEANKHTGFEVGAQYELPIKMWLSFQPTLRFVQKGFNLSQTPLGVTDNSHVSINYLELPLLMKLKLVSDGKVTPFIFAGPNPAVKLSGGSIPLDDGETLDTSLRHYDVSLDFGVGADLTTSPRAKTFIAFEYSVGFVNINPGEDGANRSIELLTGIGLNY
jgi:radical SAM protein (TIGR01212 family)